MEELEKLFLWYTIINCVRSEGLVVLDPKGWLYLLPHLVLHLFYYLVVARLIKGSRLH